MPTDYSALYALAGTVFGGAGLEITKRWLGRSKDRDDSATQFRKELRDDLTAIKAELDAVEKELDTWKEKYYSLYEKYLTVKGQLEEALRQIQRDANTAVNRSKAAEDNDPVLSPQNDPDLDTDGLDSHGHK